MSTQYPSESEEANATIAYYRDRLAAAEAERDELRRLAVKRIGVEAENDALRAERDRLRAALREIVEEMRSERPRYKSHDLGYVDSVSANNVDDWADRLAALTEGE